MNCCRILFVSVVLAGLLTGVIPIYSQEAAVQDVMGFEIVQDVWVTEADLSEFKLTDLLCELTALSSGGTSYAKLRRGIDLSTEYVMEGVYSGKWAKHAQFPTMATTNIEHDWTSYSAISFWVYSEAKTDEEIFLALHSDSAGTLWKDFFYTSFAVNWTGWKQITIPFSEFSAYEVVAGWGKIDSIFFYTKGFDREPNPYTVLYFDAMKLELSTGVETNDSQPGGFSLGQNYPNPFNGNTVIPFFLSDSGKVTVDIYTSLGQHIETLIDDHLPAGNHCVSFNPAGLAAGIYLYSVTTAGRTMKKQMMYLK